MTALIVDDSRFMRAHLRQLLERLGVQCMEAADGREALDKLRGDQAFALMLLDVNMPRMTGLECVKALREAGLGAGIKVMMVTTESDNAFIESALKYGADEFLMKPFTAESLREKLAMMGLAA
jgi:two-component system, chemotaxis family, chemotaxis protein CheY